MAATIPYPSIVFVPLDILTAEELNQLHANTTALADLFPLAAASIADGAITNTKINYSSAFPALMSSSTTQTTISSAAGTFSDYLTLDVSSIPTGAKFLVLAQAVFGGGDTEVSMGLRLSHSSSTSPEMWQTGKWWKTVSAVWKFEKLSGVSQVHLQAGRDNSSTCSIQDRVLAALRVG